MKEEPMSIKSYAAENLGWIQNVAEHDYRTSYTLEWHLLHYYIQYFKMVACERKRMDFILQMTYYKNAIYRRHDCIGRIGLKENMIDNIMWLEKRIK